MYLVCVPTAAFSSTAYSSLSLSPLLTAATLSACSALFIYFASPANRAAQSTSQRTQNAADLFLSSLFLFANAL